MFNKKDIDALKRLLELSDNADAYLFGPSLRDICLGNNQDLIDVLIYDPDVKLFDHKTKVIYDELQSRLRIIIVKDKDIYDSYLNFTKGLTTLDTIRLSVKDLVLNNNGDIQSDGDGVKHLINKEIHFTDYGIQRIFQKPELAFEIIIFSSQHNFSLSIESMKFIFDCRHLIKDVNKNRVNDLLKELFNKSHKIRKGIALVNTLGLSMELFGVNLNESSILNHLNKKDRIEYFTIIFQNVDPVTIDDFLVNKAGFHSDNTDDVKDIVNETRALCSIEDESDITARKIISSCGKNRISNLIRLLKLSGFKELSKKLKEQKDAVTSHSELAVTLQDLQASFKVTEQEANKLLDLALDKVIVSPELNNQYQLLTTLNRELESVKHG